MQMNDLDWNDLKLFLAIARTGNLTRAAKELGIHHSTAFRRLTDFEDKANAKLFDRRPSGYLLTEAGALIAEDAALMSHLGKKISATLENKEHALQGHIKVTFPATLSLDRPFMDALSSFAAEQPGISLELICSTVPIDMEKFEADIAFRFTNSPPPALIGRKIGQIKTAVFEADNIPSNNRNNWVTCYSKEFRQDMPRQGMKLVSVSDGLTQLQAVNGGLGQARLPLHQAALYPALRRTDNNEQPFLDFWMLYHPDQKAKPQIKLMVTHMLQALAANKRF